MKSIALSAILLAAGAAFGAPICSEEKGTRKVFCVQSLAANGDLRGGDLWTGGPNNVTKADLLLIVNCRSQVTVLQDSNGVNIGASRYGDQPRHMNDLYSKICAAKTTRTDKKLRQF